MKLSEQTGKRVNLADSAGRRKKYSNTTCRRKACLCPEQGMQLQARDGGPFVFCVDKESDGVIGKLHALQKVAMIPGVAKKTCMPMDESH
jgi:hypothetical protein